MEHSVNASNLAIFVVINGTFCYFFFDKKKMNIKVILQNKDIIDDGRQLWIYLYKA